MIDKLKQLYHNLDILQRPDLLKVTSVIICLLVFASLSFWIVKKLKPKANTKELIQRTNSWWVMVLFFIGSILLDTKIAFPAIGILSFVAFRELYSILNFRDSDRKAIFWAFLCIPFQYYLAYIGWYELFIIFIPVWMFLILPARFILIGNTDGIIKSMSSLQWCLMLTVFSISHLAYFLSLSEIDNFRNGGQGLLLFLIFVTQINDVMQFIWGKIFGKHKIIPKISPNKTWEGFTGGLISTVIIGYFLKFLTPMSDLQVITASFLIGLSGFFGDLVMSAIKRDLKLKDTSNAIPGHGGVLDRLDSLIYTSPVFFHLIYYWFY
jgi:phosphatidate cytidylyltransferase